MIKLLLSFLLCNFNYRLTFIFLLLFYHNFPFCFIKVLSLICWQKQHQKSHGHKDLMKNF